MTTTPLIRPGGPYRPHRLRPWQFGVVVAALVLAVGGLAALVTAVFYAGPKPQCVPPHCPVPTKATQAVVPLNEEQVYRSPRLGFAVGYSGDWGNSRALPGGGV